ncbi:MAG: GxxExxY protein, partial [Spartobacteria bacterium]|nr:GxxExxY protein [Spartobacteria bacterium]
MPTDFHRFRREVVNGDPETYAIIGAAMDVHRELGCGFLEAVYQEALEVEFKNRSIPYASKPRLPIAYKETILKKYYDADFICYESIVVEIKAQENLAQADEGQLINYLHATKLSRGLLINFGA